MSPTDTDDVADAADILEALASLPSFHHPTVSPDGSTVALYYDGSGRNELHLIDVETGERERVTDGEVPRDARWHLLWAGNDEVFFHADEAGDEQNDLHVVDREGNASPVLVMDGQIGLADVTEDGRTLLVGSTRDGQMNLYRHDRGGETTKLTDYERAVSWWAACLSPDGDRIAYATNESADVENMDVYVADADGSDPRNLALGETGAESAPVEFSPDGTRLLVADNSTDLGRSGVYDLDSGEVTWFHETGEEVPRAFLDGGRFLVSRTRNAAVAKAVYDVDTGESREFDLPTGVTGFSMAGDPVVDDERVVFSHTTPSTRPELLVYDVADDTTRTLLEPEYGPFSPEEFADAEFLTFDSDGVPETPARAVEHDPDDELEIEALLYDSGERPSPLLVKVHGGPRAADHRAFDLYTQFLVSRGYSVLQVNYRGSSGRGRGFVRRLYGDWGGAEQGDVAVGTEHVLGEYDWLDGGRVAVFGGSYGGYSAYWQTVQYPALYDLGVAWIGLTDLREMYETTMPHFRTELMEKNLGTPDENPALYRERSPIEHAGNLDCPLLMIHGVNDRRVPVSQARLYRDRLRELGYEVSERDPDGPGDSSADVEYVELGEEGHASSDIDRKVRLFRVLDDFLERRTGTSVTRE
jgi:dipeptidyl aminopeptidase/acylaminoacyl peptidase